jgi:hypothetical protein
MVVGRVAIRMCLILIAPKGMGGRMDKLMTLTDYTEGCVINKINELVDFVNDTTKWLSIKQTDNQIDVIPVSLRDAFAGQIMSGMFASQGGDMGMIKNDKFDDLAAICYKFADSLVKARIQETACTCAITEIKGCPIHSF